MASQTPPGDPRVMARLPDEAGVMPVVNLPRSGIPAWVMILAVVLAGILLFIVLDSRRRAPTAPSVRERAGDQLATPAPPPPLFVPNVVPPPVVQMAPSVAPSPAVPAQPRVVYVPQPYPVPAPAAAPEVAPAPPPRVPTEAALVYDAGGTAPAQAAAPASGETAAASPAVPGAPMAGGRARAGVFANRSTTVTQGTLIPAVLETALNSTRPGLARAVVSRDVRGFDGSRVLIPRGSRLIGEYRSDVTPGQNRALINWTRLIRPDGATMAIGSQAGDPLGRGGVRARVNSHFWERFAGAILQTALDIGVNLAASEAGGTVVVIPGAVTQGTSQLVPQQQITPTLTVRQGTSISIVVARDLDFTTVERSR